MTQPYDFWIGDLGFNTCISKERPYERATAQFRKDQLDQSASVGDQSLTGWWTRGQLSFHKGAGVKYYEVLGDSDNTIENRFHDSMDVDPGTPGEVGLGNTYTSYSATAPRVNDMVPASYGGNFGVMARQSNGTVRMYTTAGAVGSSLYSNVSAFVSANGALLYIDSTDGKIKSDPTESGSLTTLWTPPGAAVFSELFYAKDRILAMDASRNWYQLTTSGGTAAVGDVFWTAPAYSGSVWVTEAPGTIFISMGNKVFSTGLDTDGLIPTLSAATVALELPYGESIGSIFYYLGYLVICTSEGVRLAAVDGNNALTVGPRFIEGDFFRSRRMIGSGDEVLLAGPVDINGVTTLAMIGLNLATLITALQPAYRTVTVIDSYNSLRGHGVARGADLSLFTFGQASARVGTSTLATSGNLTTGFHRFGTLEAKAFRFLRVKTEGTEGDIDVVINTPDGTTYTVGTVAAGDTAEFDLGGVSGFPTSLEYLSITFTLNRGTTTGPTLLGYQLKALPVPKRQRMIRVPLMLFDNETNRGGQQILADPWTRLAALESLEQSNALVSFEDTETGEAGSAYIESVEVSRISPAIAGKQGFGGTIYLTLRCLT